MQGLNNKNGKRYFSVAETSEYLESVSARTIYRGIEKGSIPYTSVENVKLIPAWWVMRDETKYMVKLAGGFELGKVEGNELVAKVVKDGETHTRSIPMSSLESFIDSEEVVVSYSDTFSEIVSGVRELEPQD